MGYEKFFLTSKTVLAAIAVMLVSLAPLLGINFGEDDAALFNEHVGNIITAVLGLIVIFGRFRATAALTMQPKPKDTTLKAHWIVTLLAIPLSLLLLAGCMTPNTATATPAQQLYLIESSFADVQEEAAIYAQRPFCDDEIIVACADAETVIKLDEASDRAEDAIAAAHIAIGTEAPDTSSAISTAKATLRVLISVLALSEAA